MTGPAELKSNIAQMLANHTVMSLATLGPHVVSLFYAHDDALNLYWVSDPRSDHSRHIGEEGPVAASIAGQFDDFPGIHGLQLTGTAKPLTDGPAERGRGLLAARFVFLGPDAEPSEATRRLALATVYQLTPDRITVIDNRQGFAAKQVWTP